MKEYDCSGSGSAAAWSADGFADWLAGRGYKPVWVAKLAGVMADLGGWLAREGLGAADLGADAVARFVAYRHAAGRATPVSPAGMGPLVGYLREMGLAPVVGGAAVGGDPLIADFGVWLAEACGLSSAAVRRHLAWVRRFADEKLSVRGWPPKRIAADQVDSFVAATAARCRVSAMGAPVAALRYFLVYASLVGLCDRALADAVPSVKRLRQVGLPGTLAPGVVADVLAGCADGSWAGLRDGALVALSGDLGLRGAEMARLTLDDIDWAHAVITVTGKNGLCERMPLTSRAGEALAAWLRDGRRSIATRHVFHSVVAPLRPMGTEGPAKAVRAAAGRVGRSEFSTRAARHSIGRAVVAGHGTLEDAGQLLRHLSSSATAVYARVDTDALSALATPWPGGAR
jgi:site-specific recombinase XerD